MTVSNAPARMTSYPKDKNSYKHLESFTIEMNHVIWDEPLSVKISKLIPGFSNNRTLKTEPVEIPAYKIIDLFIDISKRYAVGVEIDGAASSRRKIEFVVAADNHDDLREFLDDFKDKLARLADDFDTHNPVISHCFDCV